MEMDAISKVLAAQCLPRDWDSAPETTHKRGFDMFREGMWWRKKLQF